MWGKIITNLLDEQQDFERCRQKKSAPVMKVPIFKKLG